MEQRLYEAISGRLLSRYLAVSDPEIFRIYNYPICVIIEKSIEYEQLWRCVCVRKRKRWKKRKESF